MKLGEQWKQEVIQATSSNTPSSATSSSTRRSQSSSSSSKVISLHRIESLLAQGDSLPFHFQELLETLREKQVFALTRLQKLRKSLMSKSFSGNQGNSSTSSVGRRSGLHEEVDNDMKSGESVSEEGRLFHGKMGLAEMKTMVSEGTQLLQEDEVHEDEHERVPSTNKGECE